MNPASSGDTAIKVDEVGPEGHTSQPESVVQLPRQDGPDRVSRVENAVGAAVGFVSLVLLIAMAAWIVTYDGPRGTQEVTCAVGICTVR
ncbi:hypothetical protein GCM10010201_35400 [Pilimelia columellifera subsp. columellifera]|uniref:Uncharacterized protein n=1 Tax=Pilimelia columellifera subsp. columellifera TaxID=706583 RepID=A0ABN3NRN4_9ACTN